MPPNVNKLNNIWLEILSILSDDVLRRTGLYWTEHVTTQEQKILQNIVSNGNTEHIIYAIQNIQKKIAESTGEKTGKILKETIQSILDTADMKMILELSKYALEIMKGLKKFTIGLKEKEISALRGVLRDVDIKGIPITELNLLRSTISTWASKTYSIKNPWNPEEVNTIGPFQGTIWLSGSILFGYSPVKGIIIKAKGKEQFFGPKPIDSPGISDIDIGLEVTQEFLEKNVPLFMLKISPTSKLQDLSLLWSRALKRDQITKEWASHREPAKRLAGQWIIKLFEELEKISVLRLQLSTKNGRPTNIRFFVKDYEKQYNSLPRVCLYPT